MTQAPPPPMPAGWYPDPANPSLNRYWTGSDWSSMPPPPTAAGGPEMPKGLAAAPKTVQVAFWLQLGAVATLGILGFLFVILALDDLNNPFLSDDDYATAFVIFLASAFGLAQAVALGVFAKFLLDGANWARIASTVALGLTLCSNVLALALGIAVIVLLFQNQSNAWFRRTETAGVAS
ncbi:DUF2510 domain-containing protein [Nocardioides humilatus]|uniref:DUF2510 domain-containing protein n=1 Tax=Nocardioides humilatus TaxID=2607660 RepID=A0A5B1LL87_9ACTN|nr:DUF2510 domain-containing protein [Nocardioides humilatus]KAA1421234.1 DUF2510 domain-containing protein [Nocardioides humilatus]